MKSDCYVPSGVPVIRGNNISDTRELTGEMVYITPEKTEELRSSIIYADDLFFPHRGSIGQVGIVPRTGVERYVLSSSLMKLTCDRKQVDPLFLFYFFRSEQGRHELLKNASTVGTPGIGQPLSTLKSIRVPVPDLSKQRTIASILGTLDDKIELNRRMNETLEAMAQALFKSWFVDPTQNGLPKGWREGSIGEVAARVAMGPFGSRITRDNFVPSGVPVIRGGNLSAGFIDQDFVFLTEPKADELKSSLAFPEDIVFTHRGTLGQVGIIPINANYPRYVVSQSQMLLSVDKRKMSPWLVYLFFRSSVGQAELLANTSTTGVPAIARPTTSLKAIRIPIPTQEFCNQFDSTVKQLFEKQEQNSREIYTLATLRDTLLSRLLTGELRVEHGKFEIGDLSSL